MLATFLHALLGHQWGRSLDEIALSQLDVCRSFAGHESSLLFRDVGTALAGLVQENSDSLLVRLLCAELLTRVG